MGVVVELRQESIMPTPQRKIGEDWEYTTGGTRGGDAHDTLQRFLLNRLEHLVRVKKKYDIGRMGGGWLLASLNRAIYTTLRDCIDLNVGDQARALLRQDHQHN